MNEQQAYEKHKNLHLAAGELGIKWQTLYWRLKQAGVSVTGDKSKYGSDKDRFAALAEREFSTLVPWAESQNERSWQPKFDFTVGPWTVEVKASRVTAADRWTFTVKKQQADADFVVCFAFDGEKYRVLLIPGEIVRNYQTIAVNRSFSGKWAKYEVQPEELAQFFKSLGEESMSKQKTYGIGSRVSFIRGRHVRVRVVGKVVNFKAGSRGQYAVVQLKGGELISVRPSQLEGPRAGI